MVCKRCGKYWTRHSAVAWCNKCLNEEYYVKYLKDKGGPFDESNLVYVSLKEDDVEKWC